MSYSRAMSIESILAEIDAEIARLTQVRTLLGGAGSVASRVTDRQTKKAPSKSRRRVLSPDARKRIADAQRKRWAAQKAKSKKDS